MTINKNCHLKILSLSDHNLVNQNQILSKNSDQLNFDPARCPEQQHFRNFKTNWGAHHAS
ncbi:hypothetical protein A7P55_03505 [Acinetobacter sp. Ac_5812]|nr:hypothetical protein [Acinetobacter sp. Ac_5812]